MALILHTRESHAVLTMERTFDLRVRNVLGEEPQIEARREQVEIKGDNARLLTNAITVRREFHKVSNETVELVGRPGDQVTIGQLWHTMAQILDRWAQEDAPAKAAAEKTTEVKK